MEREEPTNVIVTNSCDTARHHHRDNGLENQLEDNLVITDTEHTGTIDKTEVGVDVEEVVEVGSGAGISCNILASEPPSSRNSVELKVN